MRKEFEMSAEDYKELLEACRPGSHGLPRGAGARTFWSLLGRRMGFEVATVRPIPSRGKRFFTAEFSKLVKTR